MAEIAASPARSGARQRARRAFRRRLADDAEARDIVALDAQLRARFDYLPTPRSASRSIPNDMDDARFDALAAIGHDARQPRRPGFRPEGAGGDQPRCRASSRPRRSSTACAPAASNRSISTCSTACRTRPATASPRPSTQALSLEPDRIALFGYAHVPWFKKHQTMIDEACAAGRGRAASTQSQRAAGRSSQAHGYQRDRPRSFRAARRCAGARGARARCTAIFRATPTIAAKR